MIRRPRRSPRRARCSRRRPLRRCAGRRRRRSPSPWSCRRTPHRRASAPPGRTGTPPPTRLPTLSLGGRTRGLFGADVDPNEPADGCIFAEVADQLADGGLRVTDEGLLEEDRVLVEAVQPTLDDLRERLLGLPLVAGELLEHGPLLLEDVGRDIVPRDVLRRRRRDVQRDVVRNLLGARVGGVDAAELDEYTDGPALVLDVLVPVDDPVRGLDARDATDLDVLAQVGAELLYRVTDRPALVGPAAES